MASAQKRFDNEIFKPISSLLGHFQSLSGRPLRLYHLFLILLPNWIFLLPPTRRLSKLLLREQNNDVHKPNPTLSAPATPITKPFYPQSLTYLLRRLFSHNALCTVLQDKR